MYYHNIHKASFTFQIYQSVFFK